VNDLILDVLRTRVRLPPPPPLRRLLMKKLICENLNGSDEETVNLIARAYVDTMSHAQRGFLDDAEYEEIIRFHKNLIRKLSHVKNHKIFTLKQQDLIVGIGWYKYFLEKKSIGGVASLTWVHEDYRKNNIGSQVKDIGHEWLVKNKIKFCRSHTHIHNKSMINLNRKFDYKQETCCWIKDLT